jgi:DNA-directed RNA polymerase specialized sigma24 family protein
MSNDIDLVPDIRSAWLRYLRRVDSIRSELHRMCRERTASIWAAEALLQQTLADGFPV